MGKLLTPNEVAEYCGVHIQTVYTWIRDGHLEARHTPGGKAIRIDSEVLERMMPVVQPGEEVVEEVSSGEVPGPTTG